MEGKGDIKIGQEQFYEILTNDDYSWQSIIYELINTEQLDPWDIDITMLTQRYLEKIREFVHIFFDNAEICNCATEPSFIHEK